MDLGQIVVDLGTQWINAKWGNQSDQWRASRANEFASFVDTGVDLPGVDVIPDNPGNGGKGYCYDPAADCGRGKWIKKRKRRRGKIITQSEIGQLQGLFAVAGKNSEITKVWIAKRA